MGDDIGLVAFPVRSYRSALHWHVRF